MNFKPSTCQVLKSAVQANLEAADALDALDAFAAAVSRENWRRFEGEP